MSIPDLPSPPELRGRSQQGLDYRIFGTVQQVLTVDLAPGQTVYSDSGAMSWMSATVQMNTHAAGGLGGMFRRAISGGTAFIVDFTAEGGPGHVAFSADFPGKVLALELQPAQELILHKHAFLAAEKSVKLDLHFSKRLGAGLVGGEGFVLQKLTGPGLVFAELDGDGVEYRLQAGEVMKVEPGHIAMFESTVGFDITTVRGFTNMLFGGEGLFLAELKGPGRAWLHTMTVSKMAHRVGEYLPARVE